MGSLPPHSPYQLLPHAKSARSARLSAGHHVSLSRAGPTNRRLRLSSSAARPQRKLPLHRSPASWLGRSSPVSLRAPERTAARLCHVRHLAPRFFGLPAEALCGLSIPRPATSSRLGGNRRCFILRESGGSRHHSSIRSAARDSQASCSHGLPLRSEHGTRIFGRRCSCHSGSNCSPSPRRSGQIGCVRCWRKSLGLETYHV